MASAICAAAAPWRSSEYLSEHGDRPLAEQDFIVLDGLIDWFVPALWKSRAEGEARQVFASNSVPALIQAAVAGAGVLPMSCYSCDPLWTFLADRLGQRAVLFEGRGG